MNCGDADDLELTKAILRGARKTSLKNTPVLIHTTGTGLVTKESDGRFRKEDKLWNNNSIEDIRAIPPDAPHRCVDLTIFQADEEGYVSAYLIGPSTIYGTGLGPCNTLSQQVPLLVELA